jgi:hypothetical protein
LFEIRDRLPQPRQLASRRNQQHWDWRRVPAIKLVAPLIDFAPGSRIRYELTYPVPGEVREPARFVEQIRELEQARVKREQ